MPSIEPAHQAPVGDQRAGARRVDEATVADVYADVIDVTRTDAKEEEITGREILQRDSSRRVRLLGGRAGDRDARPLIHVDRETAAIEAVVIGSAEPIGGADEALCIGRNRPTGARARLGRAWRGSAGREEACRYQDEQESQGSSCGSRRVVSGARGPDDLRSRAVPSRQREHHALEQHRHDDLACVEADRAQRCDLAPALASLVSRSGGAGRL